MPYRAFRRGGKYCVYKLDASNNRTGGSLGCHPSRARAQRQVAALYASEGSKSADVATAIEELEAGLTERARKTGLMPLTWTFNAVEVDGEMYGKERADQEIGAALQKQATYVIRQDGGNYCVFRRGSNRKVGCFPDRGRARRRVRQLNARMARARLGKSLLQAKAMDGPEWVVGAALDLPVVTDSASSTNVMAEDGFRTARRGHLLYDRTSDPVESDSYLYAFGVLGDDGVLRASMSALLAAKRQIESADLPDGLRNEALAVIQSYALDQERN